jgi:hypothetical protein
MNRKRIAAAILWFFAGWYAAAFAAFLLGAPDVLGPIVGAALAAIFAGDPLGRIWSPREPAVAADRPATDVPGTVAEQAANALVEPTHSG